MSKRILIFFLVVLIQSFSAIDLHLSSKVTLPKNGNYYVYHSADFPLVVHVVTFPSKTIDLKLVPAMGQREEVSSIGKRVEALVAVNGSNYRRGGRYNGNRVNLFYLHGEIGADLQLLRGSLGWKNALHELFVDMIYLKVQLSINKCMLQVDQINQPRIAGQSVLYTDAADPFLLFNTRGINIIINNEKIVENITDVVPGVIPRGWYVYQVDASHCLPFQKGMPVALSFELLSSDGTRSYNGCDFILGGAGLLMQGGQIKVDHLCNEFSQGAEVVHCNDEVVADFHTAKMQEWLIAQRHPRTAIGITSNDDICVVVVDGRQESSEGLTLNELALFMRQIGCVHGLNIGGGGCTTLWIENKVVNRPSAGAERPVSEALCFF